MLHISVLYPIQRPHQSRTEYVIRVRSVRSRSQKHLTHAIAFVVYRYYSDVRALFFFFASQFPNKPFFQAEEFPAKSLLRKSDRVIRERCVAFSRLFSRMAVDPDVSTSPEFLQFWGVQVHDAQGHEYITASPHMHLLITSLRTRDRMRHHPQSPASVARQSHSGRHFAVAGAAAADEDTSMTAWGPVCGPGGWPVWQCSRCYQLNHSFDSECIHCELVVSISRSAPSSPTSSSSTSASFFSSAACRDETLSKRLHRDLGATPAGIRSVPIAARPQSYRSLTSGKVGTSTASSFLSRSCDDDTSSYSDAMSSHSTTQGDRSRLQQAGASSGAAHTLTPMPTSASAGSSSSGMSIFERKGETAHYSSPSGVLAAQSRAPEPSELVFCPILVLFVLSFFSAVSHSLSLFPM